MAGVKLTKKLIEGLKKGEQKAFDKMEKFLRRFKGNNSLKDSKDTAILSCAKYYYNSYAQKYLTLNLELAVSHLQTGSQKQANLYLQKAGFYLQKLPNQPPKSDPS